MTYPLWINGSAEGQIDPADRGLAYGDGLFETLLLNYGHPVLLAAHLSRLAHSAAVLAIPLERAVLEAQLQAFLAICPKHAVIKVLVTRGSSGRGYLPDPQATPTIVLSAHPVPAATQASLRVAVADFALSRQPLLAGHKHLNRLEQVLLRAEQAQKNVDELLVFDTDGFLTEGVSSNVFFVRDQQLHTPKITHAGVRGVMRQAILDCALMRAVPVQEGQYRLADIQAASEIFFCNSVMGIRPVAQWRQTAGDKVFTDGPVTQQLMPLWQQLKGA